ncbi:MAG: amidase [Acidimicrobiales bacterium]|nr:amidase [Acidimicrobiales bacterium]
MTETPQTPWLDDACSLVEAYRSGDRDPVTETEACLAAIEASELNAFSHIDAERALEAAATADVSLPFGGVPMGVKELDKVAGWPDTEASVVFRDRVGAVNGTMIDRLVDAGAALVGMCTASEFGGLNVSTTKLNGTTHNPWEHGRTAGGSSGGSSSAVAGGLVPIATGGDGGGSIRIPAAFTGLVGMKGTAGRIPRGPKTEIAPLTVVKGCQARSVRDVARWYDVCAGYDMRDPYSLPSHGRWEADLGTHDLTGMKVVIAPDLGKAVLRPEVEANVREAAAALISDAGLVEVDVAVEFPGLGLEWAMSNLSQLFNDVRDLWPDCKDDLTKEMAFGLEMAHGSYDLAMAATVERNRTDMNEKMAAVFDEADFIISATNPDVAYPAEITANTRVGDQKVGLENNGVLTIPANIVGNPAISVPVAPAFGLPVGMQIMTRHHDDALLLDLARIVEQTLPWPLVAESAPV